MAAIGSSLFPKTLTWWCTLMVMLMLTRATSSAAVMAARGIAVDVDADVDVDVDGDVDAAFGVGAAAVDADLDGDVDAAAAAADDDGVDDDDGNDDDGDDDDGDDDADGNDDDGDDDDDDGDDDDGDGDDGDVDGDDLNDAKRHDSTTDVHGGVPMGPQEGCDDGKTDLWVDWNSNSSREYTCVGDTLKPVKTRVHTECEKKSAGAVHVCLPTEIKYNVSLPTSGWHRPVWAHYGEYQYVPPQRWLHNLEHGGIVMLYHPCADPEQVEVLRRVVTGCLRKHVISPSLDVPQDTPLALLSWGCKVTMSKALPSVARNFIVTQANKGREMNVALEGQYTQGLLIGAQPVYDYRDTVLCPHFNTSGAE